MYTLFLFINKCQAVNPSFVIYKIYKHDQLKFIILNISLIKLSVLLTMLSLLYRPA